VGELPNIEGFRFVAELGSGSLSSVYRATEEPLGRAVAIKLLSPTISPLSPFATHLEREAKVLASLCHPNVGMLHAFVKTETRMYLVLEFVDGFSLQTVVQKKPSVPHESVAIIGAAVARGLAHAHERSVVHRNVKPSNILLSRRGDVKLFDFGVAQVSPNGQESPGLSPARPGDIAALGTPAYMSPEQILGEAVDPRSDVFSLGVVLYQLVCGARPFERGDETDRRPTAHRIRRDPPIPLHRRAPDVPPALERVIMRAIEKLPANRFPSAEGMADRLEELAVSRSRLVGDRLVVRALAHAGLAPAADPEGLAAPRGRARASMRTALAGLAVLSATTVGGGAVLQATAHREGHTAGARPLDLVPASQGYLRVLATPWAEVWVDGQRVEVTPFAHAIPLSPGTHYVTLVHPSAPLEKRTVGIGAGETRTVDVLMAVPEPKTRDEAVMPTADRGKP
jgi:eukaryotic-like serine/threonine-protein kinase